MARREELARRYPSVRESLCADYLELAGTKCALILSGVVVVRCESLSPFEKKMFPGPLADCVVVGVRFHGEQCVLQLSVHVRFRALIVADGIVALQVPDTAQLTAALVEMRGA